MSTLVTLILETIWLSAYFSGLLYIPAYLLISRFKFNRLDTASLSLVFAIAYYSLVIYLVRSADLPFYFGELILILPLLINFYQVKKLFTKNHLFTFIANLKTHLSLIITILTTSLVQAAVLLRSGVQTSNGVSFTSLSFHDSTQHLTIIDRLYHSSQLSQPGFGGAVLTNYHYLIDLTLAAITRFSFLSLFDIYYRFYPLTISIAFSLILFVLVRKLSNSSLLGNFAILFTVFAGNASYFVHFFRGSEFTYGSNTFMINPIVDILQNPASIFVLSELLAIIYLVSYGFQAILRHRHLLIIITAIIAGTMIGFKAWGGLLIFGGLGLAGIWHWFVSKDKSLFLTWILTIIITLVLFLPHYQRSTSASPIWFPGWTLKVMVNDADRWNYLQDIFKEQFYIVKHHPVHLFALYLKWFFIYLIGNYWFRLIGLLFIFSWIIKLPKLKSSQILIISVTLASLMLPIFFNQGRMAYDIEQFSPYALVLASIYTIIFLWHHFIKKLKPPVLQSLVLIILILICLPSNFTSLKARIKADPVLIPQELMNDYHQINHLVPPDATIMLYPSDRNNATLEFAAFTGRNTFYSGRTLSVIVGNDYDTRKKELKDFFDHYSGDQKRQYLINHHIDYLFLYPEDLVKRSNIPDFAQPLFENSSGSLYYLDTR